MEQTPGLSLVAIDLVFKQFSQACFSGFPKRRSKSLTPVQPQQLSTVETLKRNGWADKDLLFLSSALPFTKAFGVLCLL